MFVSWGTLSRWSHSMYDWNTRFCVGTYYQEHHIKPPIDCFLDSMHAAISFNVFLQSILRLFCLCLAK